MVRAASGPSFGEQSISEEVFASQERVSGFPEKGADLRGSSGNLRGSSGNFRGSLGNFRGTPGLLLSSTVRGGSRRKTSGEVRGTSGEVRETSGSSAEPDSLPATRQISLQLFPLKVGLRWVFVNGLKWVQNGFLGAKVGENWVKTHLSPTLSPFRVSAETHFSHGSRGMEIVF